ncbi:MAG: transcription termination factor Rho [Clostridia bacterium]|nr:transcription termination factor Rho [Clostridia bacterium]
MDTSYLYVKTGAELKLLCRQAGIKLPSGANKAKMIELLTQSGQQKKAAAEADAPAAETAEAIKTAQELQSAPAQTEAPKRRGRAPKAQAADKTAKAADAAEPAQPKDAASEKPARTRKAKPAADSSSEKSAHVSVQSGADAQAEPVQRRTVRSRKKTPSADAPEQDAREQTQPTKADLQEPVRQVSGADAAEDAASEAPAEAAVQKEPLAAAQNELPAAAPEAGAGEESAQTEQTSDRPVYNDPIPQAEWGVGEGVLEILPDGYGFLRAENCLPGPRDVYLSQTQIRRFNLRNGDYIVGRTRPQREGDRYEGMIYVSTVNGASADSARRRPRFEDLTPIFPDTRLRLEDPLGNTDLALRTIDLIAPIGKGQRGLIVSPPKAGKTILLQKIANAITMNYPKVQLMIVLIDERPEEVTDMQRSTHAEVFYSTFDEEPENHTRLSEMVLDKAQRQVEMGEDVVILLDSITRLARAYNLVIPPTGRSLSGGLDPGALYKPKKFFGSARNIEHGGSLTIIATALVDTGSRLDDIIYEEFKGTGNMELHLDRKLSERRVFPAIDINRSGTRRDELLYTPQEAAGALQIRRSMASASNQDSTEQLLSLMEKTSTNAQLVERMKGWMAALSKS